VIAFEAHLMHPHSARRDFMSWTDAIRRTTYCPARTVGKKDCSGVELDFHGGWGIGCQ